MKPLWKKIVLSTAAALLLTASSAAALREAASPVSPGLELRELTEDAAGGYEQYCVLRYTPGQGTAASVLASDTVWGRDDPEELMQQTGSGAEACVNADFFTMTTGVPEGILVRSGELYCSDSWQNAVGIMEDGSFFIGRPEMVMRTEGAASLQISYLNKTRTKSGLYLYSTRFGGEEHITGSGTNVLLRMENAEALHVGDAVRCTVESVRTQEGLPDVQDGYLILSCAAGGPAEQLSGLAAGDTLTIRFSCADPRWSKAAYACGAGEMLIENGTVCTGLEKARKACTALGIRPDGEVILLTGDGKVTGSVGTSHARMAQELSEMGCVTAVNLDGGGSTTLIASYPGERERSLVNTPEDGSVRPCASYLVFDNISPVQGTASALYLRPSQCYALPGAAVELSVTATDENLHPVSGVSPTVTASGGVLNGTTLTVLEPGVVSVQASQTGLKSAAAAVEVLSTVDVVRIRSSGANISRLSLDPGESVDLEACAYFNGKEVLSRDISFVWSVDAGVGTVDSEGVFTAGTIAGLTGTLTAVYGDKTARVEITVGRMPQVLEDFESDIPGGAEKTQTDVHNGHSAGVFDSALMAEEGAAEIAAGPYALDGARAATLWVKGTGSISLVTDAGETAVYTAQEDWQQAVFLLPENAGAIRALRMEGELTLDQLVAWPAAPSQEDVRIELDCSDGIARGWVLDPSGYALKQSDITLTADGVRCGCTYDASTGYITAGVGDARRITVTVRDAAGTICRASFLQSTDGARQSFADMDGHWASDAANALAGTGIITGTVRGGETWFDPAANATREQIAVMIARALKLDMTDTDVSVYADAQSISPWARGAAAALYKAGIMQGSERDGRLLFRPAASVTRQETAALLGRMLERGCRASPERFADDAQIASWARESVAVLKKLGVLTGYADGTFRPEAPVTRAELAAMLDRLG